ncbi:alpha/beta hydrolase [Monashia sp. NPDC004114]
MTTAPGSSSDAAPPSPSDPAADPARDPARDPRSEAILSRTSPPAETTRTYGPDAAQVYDVLRPAPGSTPQPATVVVVHGGFWRAAYDRAHAMPLALGFADAGYHVALAEYRRAGMPGGGVPGTLDDVRDLVVAVARDEELPGPLILVGHSAGGHLVAWVANQPWAREAGVVGVVALAGVVDLGTADRLGLGSGAVRAFVGTGPGTPAFTAADPMSSLPPRVPVRLVTADQDDTVPPGAATDYLAQAVAAGGDATEQVVRDAGHYSLIDPDDPVFATVLATVAPLTP